MGLPRGWNWQGHVGIWDLISRQMEQAWGFQHLHGSRWGDGSREEGTMLICHPGVMVDQAWGTLNSPGTWVCGGIRSQASTHARSLEPRGWAELQDSTKPAGVHAADMGNAKVCVELLLCWQGHKQLPAVRQGPADSSATTSR